MKKMIMVVMAAVMVAMIAACGGGGGSSMHEIRYTADIYATNSAEEATIATKCGLVVERVLDDNIGVTATDSSMNKYIEKGNWIKIVTYDPQTGEAHIITR